MEHKKKILYVDDEFVNLRIFEINLSKKYEVLTAESGMAGLDLLTRNPDIIAVVSDLRMPVMDGLAFIKTAKQLHPDLVYYLLTGFEMQKDIAEAIESKLIQKYFKKPVDMVAIDTAIMASAR